MPSAFSLRPSVVAAALAAISFSSAASALNTNVIRAIRSSNLPLQNLLGVVTFSGSNAFTGTVLLQSRAPLGRQTQTVVRFDATRR